MVEIIAKKTTLYKKTRTSEHLKEHSGRDLPGCLEEGKLYRVYSPYADDHGMLRVVDESGSDYLHLEIYFEPEVYQRNREIFIDEEGVGP